MGFEAQILNALSEIPVHMISYGGSDYNLTVLVEAAEQAPHASRPERPPLRL